MTKEVSKSIAAKEVREKLFSSVSDDQAVLLNRLGVFTLTDEELVSSFIRCQEILEKFIKEAENVQTTGRE